MVIKTLEELKEAVIELDKNKAYILRMDHGYVTETLINGMTDLLKEYRELGYNFLIVDSTMDIFELSKE